MGVGRTKKSKSKRSTLASNAISRCRGLFAAIVFFSFCVNLLTLVLPLYMVQLYDRVLPNRSVDTLLVLTAIVLIALMTSAGLDAVRATLLTRMGAWGFARSLPDKALSLGIRIDTVTRCAVDANIYYRPLHAPSSDRGDYSGRRFRPTGTRLAQ